MRNEAAFKKRKKSEVSSGWRLANGSAISCGPAEDPATPTDSAPNYTRSGRPHKGRQLHRLVGQRPTDRRAPPATERPRHPTAPHATAPREKTPAAPKPLRTDRLALARALPCTQSQGLRRRPQHADEQRDDARSGAQPAPKRKGTSAAQRCETKLPSRRERSLRSHPDGVWPTDRR
jgi:hypothetical protein